MKKVESVLNDYLGETPENFSYKGKNYTPKTFFSDVLQLNVEDYIEITSFTHQEYYKKFCLHDKYNWASNLYMNVPFDEFFETIDYALKKGYTVNWNGDVSETGFDFYKGTAILNINVLSATAELRQEYYNNQKTTVDHLMNIVGTAKNNKGEKYYIIKNSWGTNNPFGGFMYMSEAYLKLKTVSITINKKAIPKDIFKKIDY
ncbi:MAG: C1 family peptidase [Bacteroidota bacterium]|nr:C1 family peptidase [Bacteroidota bacterium]